MNRGPEDRYKDDLVVRPSHLYNGNSYTGTTSLYLYIETAPCWRHLQRLTSTTMYLILALSPLSNTEDIQHESSCCMIWLASIHDTKDMFVFDTFVYIISRTCASFLDFLCHYCKTSSISCTLVSNTFVDSSDVVGASPVGAAPTKSSFST